MRQDALLWSLNARAGAVLRAFEIADPGADFPPLTPDYLDEILYLWDAKQKAIREAAETAHGG